MGAWFAAAGLAIAVVMVVVAVSIARTRGRAARVETMDAHLAASDRAEASGNLDEALAEVEAALKLARVLGPDRLASVQPRRDHLVLKDVEARLASTASLPNPTESLRLLLRRVESDRALETARGGVLDALAEARSRDARTGLAEAAKALFTGHFAIALRQCERVSQLCDKLGYERSADLRREAEGLVEQIVSRAGVVFEPIAGEFLNGSSAATGYAATLHPILARALASRGLLPKPERSPFASIWDSLAPFRVAIEVIERNDGLFFQTPLHTTRIHVLVALRKGDRTLWQTRVQGRTRVPPPSMSAFESSRLTLAKTGDPAAEKRLYDDARLVLLENFPAALRNLTIPATDAPAS